MAETPIGEIILTDVRLSFAALFEPGKPQKDDEGVEQPGKYKANFLMEKGTNPTKALMAKCKAVSEQVKAEKWGKKIPTLKAEKVFLRDGDQEDWEGYAGTFYISANNPEQPVLVDRVKDAKGKWLPLTKENGGTKKLYSGCYVNAIIRVWAQDNKHGKRLNASVESVQFLRHGEPFSGHTPVDPNEKFGDLPDEDTSDYGADDDSGLV